MGSPVRPSRRSALRRFAPVALAILAGGLSTVSPAAAQEPTTYYVSPDGNDNEPGDAPRPFRTIQKCAQEIKAGDTCLIGPGTYRETVRPTRSGTAQSPITYRAQTPGTVRIDGTDPVTAWTRVKGDELASMSLTDPHIGQSPFAEEVKAGRVYQAQVTVADPAITEGQLFLGEQMMRDAQFPDAAPDPLEPTVQVAQAGSTITSIADPELSQPPGYWTGARVYVQTNWKALTGEVKSSAPGTIAIGGHYGVNAEGWNFCAEVKPGWTRYFLYGKLSEVSAAGEWFYDRAKRTLYFRPPDGEALAGAAVKQRPYAFDLDGISDTRLDGLEIFGATIRTGDTSQRVVLSGLDVKYPSHFQDFKPDPNSQANDGCDSLSAGASTTGIIVRGTDNVVRDSEISWSAGNGIALLGNRNTVTNNVIHDVDYSGGRGAGVRLAGNDQTVTGNTIYSSGRAAIEVRHDLAGSQMHRVRIAHNDMYEYGRLSQDFGGVYICCGLDFAGSSIDHNWVHDPRDLANIPSAASLGIYIDGGSANQLIHSNVGWNNDTATVGLVANDGINNKVYNNNGVVWVYNLKNATGTEILNNIGDVILTSSDSATIRVGEHLPSAIDPRYTNEPARDFSLKPTSPAIDKGQQVPIFADGSPDLGAYQHGEAYWRPGASWAPALPIRPHYGASSLLVGDTAWNDQLNALHRRDFPNGFAFMSPFAGPVSGTLRLGFDRPLKEGLAIDKVELRLYARMHREPGAKGNMTVDLPGLGTVWNAEGSDFDATGRAITVPLTNEVDGDWSKLPAWVEVFGDLSGGTPGSGWTQGFDGTVIVIIAAEIYIEAHRA